MNRHYIGNVYVNINKSGKAINISTQLNYDWQHYVFVKSQLKHIRLKQIERRHIEIFDCRKLFSFFFMADHQPGLECCRTLQDTFAFVCGRLNG